MTGIMGNWGGHPRRLTKELREEILRVYLADPIAGTTLAVNHGLTPAYAYKLAHERGLLPVTRWISKAAKERAFA